MRSGYDLTPEVSLRPVVGPGLIYALKILKLGILELSNLISQEIEENPFLEEVEDLPPNDMMEEEKEDERSEWDDYMPFLPDLENPSPDEDRYKGIDSIAAPPPSLHEHLFWQLALSDLSEEDKEIGEMIIEQIDKSGYFRGSVDEIARSMGKSTEEVERVLSLIQKFDPPGVGARDLRECLLLQLRAGGLEGGLEWRIVKDHLEDLEGNDGIHKIAEELGVESSDIEEALELIRSLNPIPGSEYDYERAMPIIPDIIVEEGKEGYEIKVNEDPLPPIRISPYYKKIMSASDPSFENAKSFLREKLRSAMWVIKGLEQRRMNLKRVADFVINHQKEFVEKGPMFLKPLRLKDVAEELGLDQSTVSRIVANKYVQTPRGIFELRHFFDQGVGKEGNTISARSIKEMIKDLISKEDKRMALTDKEIAEILRRKGIDIARRTVAKYREELGIPSSEKRRKGG